MSSRRLLIGGVVAALALAVWFWTSETQRRLVAGAPSLPVNFAHVDHRTENCVGCHHNFVDRTGSGLCFDCHERSEQVGHLLEAQFHGLCRDCHVTRQAAGEPHGPTRRCLDCHVTDPFP